MLLVVRMVFRYKCLDYFWRNNTGNTIIKIINESIGLIY